MLFKRLFQAATICEYQSISEAARTLGISQSTLSASVAGLEQIVGNRLFERAFRGVYPLASAWSIYCQMDEIDWQLRRVESLRESHGEDTSCSPTIVLPETMAGGQLHRSLRAGVGSGMFRLIIEDNSFPRGHRLRMSVPDSISPQSSHVCDYGWSVVALAKTMDTVPGSPLDMDLLRHRSIAIAGLGDFEQQALEKMLVEDVMKRLTHLSLQHWQIPRYLIEEPGRVLIVPEHTLLPVMTGGWLESYPLKNTDRLALVIDRDKEDPQPEDTERLAEQLRALIADFSKNRVRQFSVTHRGLRSFETLYTTRSVSKAARQLHVVQPAMSKQIKNLEASIGTKLFDRSTTGVTPRESAHRLHRVTKQLLAQVENLLTPDKKVVGSEHTIVTIGYLPAYDSRSAIAVALRDTIEEWRKTYPLLHLISLEGYSKKQFLWLQEKRILFAIVESLYNMEGLHSIRLRQDPLSVYLGPGVEARDISAPLMPEDLMHLKLILPSPDHGIRTLIDRQFAKLGIKLQPELEIDSLASLVMLVKSGNYATILPENAIMETNSELRKRELHSASLARTLYLVHRAEEVFGPPEQKIISLLIKNLDSGNSERKDVDQVTTQERKVES
ncbi:MAG: LysR family transcriptional regulator [Halioglobus sp.]|nr:LysR family transcriptional regulator [Halioglobus sp.]